MRLFGRCALLCAALGLFAVLAACAGAIGMSRQPVWVLDPPADTAADLWGVGEGPDLDTARSTALRSVAARLRVSISGTVERTVVVANQSVHSLSQSRVREEVQDTEFVGVSIDRAERSNNGVHVLVRIDRRAWVQDTRSRFYTVYQRVQRSLNDLDAKGALEQVRVLRGVQPDVDQGLRLGQLLATIGPSAADPGAMAMLERTRTQGQTATSKLLFSLEHQPKDADVAAALAEFLTTQGLRASRAEPGLLLRLQVTTRHEALFDNWMCRLQVSLEWLDNQGQPIGGRQHTVNGLSLVAAEQACQDAVRRFAQVLKTAGLQAGLGLPL
jgi:hypothetical protein